MQRPVVVLSAIPKLSQCLRAALPSVSFLDVYLQVSKALRDFSIHEDDTISHLSKVQVIVADANLLIPYINNLSSTKWVQATWAGLENLISAIKDETIPFTITRFTGENFGYAMSEYVVSQIVNYERDQRKQTENQSSCLWSQSGKIGSHRRLSDLTIGILGMGEIGMFIAKVLKTFGATVWGMSRTARKIEFLDKHVTTDSLHEILKNCDYIINVMPSTQATKGLLNGDVLKNCENKKSMFMNIGRGSIIKETDLINALEQQWISGAILDVFEQEPLPSHSKLWKLPQVVISPHTSGVSRPEDIAQVFAENYAKFIKGDQLKNVIDVNRGY